MPSPIAMRLQQKQEQNQERLEQEELSEIDKQDQELREQRGFSRSPGMDAKTEEEYNDYIDRTQNHYQSNFNRINQQQLLEHFINDNINKAIENNQENIGDLSHIFNDNTITLDVISKMVLAARNNTYWFMINSTPNYENLPLLTNEIFLFSLFDIGTGYKDPNYTSRPNYMELLQSMRKDRFDSLVADNFFSDNPRLGELCFQNMENLVEKNINDGASIKKEEKKKISFGSNSYKGGKTKRRRQNRKKSRSRKPKKIITIKRK